MENTFAAYNIVLRHTRGKNNLAANFMSRLNSMNESNNENLDLTTIVPNLVIRTKR